MNESESDQEKDEKRSEANFSQGYHLDDPNFKLSRLRLKRYEYSYFSRFRSLLEDTPELWIAMIVLTLMILFPLVGYWIS